MKKLIYIIGCLLGFITGQSNLYSQCPDLTLPVDGENICFGDYGIATIQNAESGVYYQAYIGGNPVSDMEVGTGADLDLLIPAIQLSAGANTVSFKAFPSPSSPGNVAIFETSTTPTLDGIPDESEWHLLGDYPNESWGTPPPDTEYNAQWGGLYDNTYLYLSARIQDGSTPAAPITDLTKLHQNDAVEFIIQGAEN